MEAPSRARLLPVASLLPRASGDGHEEFFARPSGNDAWSIEDRRAGGRGEDASLVPGTGNRYQVQYGHVQYYLYLYAS
jgi:hypothetical protein